MIGLLVSLVGFFVIMASTLIFEFNYHKKFRNELKKTFDREGALRLHNEYQKALSYHSYFAFFGFILITAGCVITGFWNLLEVVG